MDLTWNVGRPWNHAQIFASDEDIKQCKAEIIHNASPSVLIEAALRREQGTFLTSTGALSVRSGAKTGRSPKDKRVVVESQSENNVWWGPVRAGTIRNAHPGPPLLFACAPFFEGQRQ